VSRRRVALLAAVAAAVGVVVLVVDTGPQDPAGSAAGSSSTPTAATALPASTAAPVTSSVAPSSTAPPAPTSSGPPVTGPPLRQRPQLHPVPGQDPATVKVIPAPHQPPIATELSTPTAAVVAWATRWCPFTYTEALGAAETRSQPAMTPAGWSSFDPRTDPVSVGAWAGVTAAGLTGTCSAPAAVISPEAPSSAVAAYVTVTLTRVVTSTTGPTTVETVTDTRLILLVDGRWLVDTPARAG
jgi:hypothetical protein